MAQFLLQWLGYLLIVIEIVVGLGMLIFLHELGHFVMAKKNGVRVEAFSLGMGPIIWKKTWNGTEYRISWIPLGGYVKMAGENIGDPRTGAPDELTSKSAWQRLQIFSAGALMNLIIAFPIAILANLCGRTVDVPEVAAPAHPETKAGMKPGDVILEVDGKPIETMLQYRKEMVRRDEGSIAQVKVRRGEEVLTLDVKQDGSERHQQMAPRMTSVGMVKEGSPAWNAGLRVGDVVVKVNGTPVVVPFPVIEALKTSPDKEVTLDVRRRTETGDTFHVITLKPQPTKVHVWPADLRLCEAIVKRVIPNSPADVKVNGEPFLKLGDVIVKVGDRDIATWLDLKEAITPLAGKAVQITRKRDGIAESAEVIPTYGLTGVGQVGIDPLTTPKLALVPEGSWWYDRGLRTGDTLLDADYFDRDPKKRSWGPMGNDVHPQVLFGEPAFYFGAQADRASIKVRVRRGDEQKTLEIEGRVDTVGDVEALGFGSPDALLRPTQFVRYWTFGDAVREGMYEPYDITLLTFQILKKLFIGQESAQNLAGPLGIMQAAFFSAEMGFGNLVWLLVLITVNLGVFNLLPIPVLDGGHVLLLAIEKIRGKPPSTKFVERFQLAGLFFLLGLILFVTGNDIIRIFRIFG